MESFLLPRVSVSPKFSLEKSFDFTSKIALKKSFSFTPKIGLKKSIAAGQIVMARRGNEEASPDEKLSLDVFTPKVEKTSDDFKILVIRKSHREVTVSCGREFGWILGGILLGRLLKCVLSLGRGSKNGHGSFSDNPTLNNVVGHLLHSSILVPYHGWFVLEK